ncbi:hypothetical protein WJX84_008617 [Apatococcus fuscideae]|uniref:YdbS-like PH domain-containing protein n=1 Tax=Apatococcus fuscideae TaxID=2026836 RepID=A0AAW1TIU7_9CHLO
MADSILLRQFPCRLHQTPRLQHSALASGRGAGHLKNRGRPSVVRAAEKESSPGSADDEFSERLASLRKAGGRMPQGESRKSQKKSSPVSKSGSKPKYDYTSEKVHYESPPHRGDLATNVLLGATLLWLPLTIASVGRAAFVKYRFTDRRVSVITNAPWKQEQLDVPYQEVKDVVFIGRGIGAWGDMVITLKNSDKIEMRSLPRFKELRDYILERREALAPQEKGVITPATSSSGRQAKGF